MRWIKWIIVFVFALMVFGTFHYAMPQRDIVRIVKTDNIRTDFSRWNRIFFAQADGGSAEAENRDVRFIFTKYENGREMVFRNEDTNAGWPFYLKFDSNSLHGEAEDLVSSRDEPIWVAITHYGWRIKWLSAYPNATNVREVAGPDVRIIPWVNIIIYIILALLLLGAFRLLQRFKRRKIDPALEAMEDRWDSVEARASDISDSAGAAKGGVLAWFKRWFGSAS